MKFLISIFLLISVSMAQRPDWTQWDTSKEVPINQMPRGREADYRPLYNTRASYNGDLLPGKFNGNTNRAYVPYNGKENSVSNFESFFRSQPASNGQFPAKAVPGRRISSGETLYIGRVEFEGSIIPRKIHPSVGILIIPYGGYELGYSNY